MMFMEFFDDFISHLVEARRAEHREDRTASADHTASVDHLESVDIDRRSAEVLVADLVVDMAEDHSLDRIDWELERQDGVDSPDKVADFVEDSQDNDSLDRAADSVADILKWRK